MENQYYIACKEGDFARLKYLISHNAITTLHDLNEGLRGACERCNLPLVEFLISMGANDWNGGIRSACSSIFPLVSLIKLMIHKGADELFPLFERIESDEILDDYRLITWVWFNLFNNEIRINFKKNLQRTKQSKTLAYMINRHFILFSNTVFPIYAKRKKTFNNIGRQFVCNDISKWNCCFIAVY